MTHRYIGTKEITAFEQDKDGQPGYGVIYADGYTSWSPKAAFEASYRIAETQDQALTFGDAVHFLKLGRRVARRGWNGKGMWLKLQTPDANSKMTLPYVYMKTADDQVVPWLASQTDVLCNDWVVLV